MDEKLRRYEINVLQPAAEEAAETAIDAHGPEGCDAEMAYDFIREVWGEQDRPEVAYLPETMPQEFAELFAEALRFEQRKRQ